MSSVSRLRSTTEGLNNPIHLKNTDALLLVIISYFCYMKRIVTLLIIIIAIFTGATTIGIPVAGHNAPDNTGLSVSQTDAHRHDCLIKDQILQSGQECLLVSGTHTLQQAPLRIQPYSSAHAYRLKSFNQLIYLQLLCRKDVCLSRSAYIQLDGYYLYHLRKLLI